MFEEMLVYLPTVIRIAALFLAVCLIYDYFKRKWAKSIVEAVKSAEASSPETALSAEELSKSCPGFKKLSRLLLRRSHSPLRRYVLCVRDEAPEEDTKSRKKHSDKLTGKERWYILTADAGSDDGEKAPAHSLPAVLRDGAEVSPAKLIIGIILLFVFSELVIHYLVPIYNFITGMTDAGK